MKYVPLYKYWVVAAKYLDFYIYNRRQKLNETLNIMLHNWPSVSQLKTLLLMETTETLAKSQKN